MYMYTYSIIFARRMTWHLENLLSELSAVYDHTAMSYSPCLGTGDCHQQRQKRLVGMTQYIKLQKNTVIEWYADFINTRNSYANR